jgi:hypothetical protein
MDARQILANRVADHPMWDGIDYTMEREARIADFVEEAVADLEAAGLL